MKAKMKVETALHRDGLIHDLRDPEFATEYIKACLSEGGQGAFLKALRNVAEAWGGPGQVAKDTELNRSGVYKMLADDGNPSYASILALLDRFGLKISVEPARPQKHRVAGRRRFEESR
jgi:probable addiction module antidote protein